MIIRCSWKMINLKIKSIDMQNFMAFNSLDVTFSPQINIIFGENGTGKSDVCRNEEYSRS